MKRIVVAFVAVAMGFAMFGISNSGSAANAAKSLAEMTKNAPSDPSKIVEFGEKLEVFGGKLKLYFNKVSGVTSTDYKPVYDNKDRDIYKYAEFVESLISEEDKSKFTISYLDNKSVHLGDKTVNNFKRLFQCMEVI